MRLLVFNMEMNINGRRGFIVRWVEALAKMTDHVYVITMSKSALMLAPNISVLSMGKERGYSKIRRALEFYRHLFRILRNESIDAAFVHMIPIFAVMAAPVLRALGVPVVTWFAHREVTFILRLAHFLSSKMVSINPASYPHHQDKLICLGHGIDTELFSPEDDEDGHNVPMLLSVGRLSPIKNLETLVAAASLLRDRGYKFSCVVVGDAPERDSKYAKALRQQVRDLGLHNVIKFVGEVPNDDVVQWYRRCFAHINCSPAEHSLDKAVLEALSCERLSLTSTLGFQETFGEAELLLLFRQGNHDELANKLENLITIPAQTRKEISAKLRERVVQQHSLTQLASRLTQLLRGLRAGAAVVNEI